MFVCMCVLKCVCAYVNVCMYVWICACVMSVRTPTCPHMREPDML